MKKSKDPGFGFSSKKDAKVIVNKDGSSNILHHNKRISFQEAYTYLIEISWFQFFVYVFVSYLLINMFFGLVFIWVGIEQIAPATGNLFKDFLNGFFFSAQTVTTVGYGKIAPNGLIGNIIAAFEALIGLLSFSFITGLLYGRFSKPKASVGFSKNIILRNFNEGKALMFRLINNRTNIMIEPSISVTLSLPVKGKFGELKREFYQLKLELETIKYLPTSWTIVHQIDEESPLYNLTSRQVKELDAEWYILMQYHDDSFAQRVYQVHSYTSKDLEVNVKFAPITHFNKDGYTVLDHKKISTLEKL